MADCYSYGPGGVSSNLRTESLGVYTPSTYRDLHKQNDPVGQYLALRAGGNLPLAYQSQQPEGRCDSYAYSLTPPPELYRQFPDPEHIRHLHTLHSLLPHLQPERKLNALIGPEFDIVNGRSGKILCRAVPKKMLIMFLGREVVRKFFHTIERQNDENWQGPPTQQNLILPYASQAALKILISWMTRACNFTTMTTPP